MCDALNENRATDGGLDAIFLILGKSDWITTFLKG